MMPTALTTDTDHILLKEPTRNKQNPGIDKLAFDVLVVFPSSTVCRHDYKIIKTALWKHTNPNVANNSTFVRI